MTAAQALEEFTDLVSLVFKEMLPDPKKQTEKLKNSIEGILERHKIAKGAGLIQSGQMSPACKLWVILRAQSLHINSRQYCTDYVQKQRRGSVYTEELRRRSRATDQYQHR
jgi:hypothetical protein